MKTLIKKFSLGLSVVLLLSGNVFARNQDIVIVHSYALDMHEWVSGQESGFKKILGDSYHFHTIYLDTKRIQKARFGEVASNALSKIEQISPALVYLTDDNAVELVGKHINPDIPVVFSGVNANIRKDYPWMLKRPNISGVLERPLIKRTLIEMKKMTGLDISNCLIILGNSTTGQAFFENDLNAASVLDLGNTKAYVVRPNTFDEWQMHVLESHKNGYTAILVGGIFGLIDGTGAKVDGYDIARWVSKNSPLPIVSVQQQVIGKDLFIGGMFMSGQLMGEDAGKIAVEILSGERPAGIGYKQQNERTFTLSKSQLIKWNLTVPENFSGKLTLIE